LKYRQQIIIKKKYLTIINDSKSTSFSSSVGMFKKASNILWLLGGIYKKGDKLELKKKDLSNFLKDRFRYYLKEKVIRFDIIEASISNFSTNKGCFYLISTDTNFFGF